MTTTKTSDMLELAAQCAREHRAQGWQGSGAEYDLGIYFGDAEALYELLGRPLTLADRVDFERMIRACLSAPGGYWASQQLPPPTITQIATLRDEALAAGDTAMAQIATAALDGYTGALIECARVLTDARAQDGGEHAASCDEQAVTA